MTKIPRPRYCPFCGRSTSAKDDYDTPDDDVTGYCTSCNYVIHLNPDDFKLAPKTQRLLDAAESALCAILQYQRTRYLPADSLEFELREAIDEFEA